jgi:hypothetical protein
MAQATDSPAIAHITNTADPVQALATCWSAIHEIDRTQRELDQGENAAQEQKEQLEEAVLALQPQTPSDALSVLLLVIDETRRAPHAAALRRVVRWLIDHHGAQSPLWPTYGGTIVDAEGRGSSPASPADTKTAEM